MNFLKFNEAVRNIYDVVLSPDRWPATMDSIAALSDSTGAILHAKTPDGWAIPVHSPSIADALEAYVKEGWSARNPWLEHSIDAGFQIGDVYQNLDIVTAEEMERNPFHAEFLARFRLGRHMAALIHSPLGNPTCLVAHRDMSKGPFQKAEVDTHLLVAHHLEQSLRITSQLMQSNMAHQTLSGAFDAIERPAFILDENLHPIKLNPSAEKIIGKYFLEEEGQLTPILQDEKDTFSDIVRKAQNLTRDHGEALQPTAISARNRKERIVVWSVPLGGASADRLGLARSQKNVLVLAQPLKQQRLVDPTVIRSVYGLTPAEARLASLLAGGRTVKQAASELGLTQGSARFVLNRIFKKVGVHRQSELVPSILALCC